MAHIGAPAGALTPPGLLQQQLDTPSRVDEITDRLITAIAIGEYLPGARLPVERDLATAGHCLPRRRGVPLRTRHVRAAGEIRRVPNRRERTGGAASRQPVSP